MALDSKCTSCGEGYYAEVDLTSIDPDILPDEVRPDSLTRMQVCSNCGFTVFHVAGCTTCNQEYECSGTGIANSNQDN